MSEERSNTQIKMGLAIGAVFLVPVLGIGVIVVNTWRPLHEAGEANARLEERFGPPGSYTPSPSAELEPARIEAFLEVRRAIHSGCYRYEPLREELFFEGVTPAPAVMASFRSMIARQHEASLGELRRRLGDELGALADDSTRFPWQEGLPPETERCLAPYRAELSTLFCAGTAGIEMDRDSGRALRIALE